MLSSGPGANVRVSRLRFPAAAGSASAPPHDDSRGGADDLRMTNLGGGCHPTRMPPAIGPGCGFALASQAKPYWERKSRAQGAGRQGGGERLQRRDAKKYDAKENVQLTLDLDRQLPAESIQMYSAMIVLF